MADAGTTDGPKAPPGWYTDPVDPAAQRYWDGAAWAPPATSRPVPSTPALMTFSRLTFPKSFWLVVGILSYVAFVGLIFHSLWTALIPVALVVLGTGLYSLVARKKTWAQLSSPRARGIVSVAAVLLLIVSSSLVPHATPAKAVAEAPSPTASAEPSATPSAAPIVDSAAPMDPEVVVASTLAPRVVIADASVTDGVTALALLDTLAVKGRAPKTGYDREGDFGIPWIDEDANNCDTRNDVLGRDLTGTDRPNGCTVLSGTLVDSYSGKTIAFVRGAATSPAVQIDHIVALLDAWQKGAQQLSTAQRIAFANDPLNLMAVDGPTNLQKASSDAATWLPPQKPFRCEYIARQVSVKATYRLWVTQAEHDAMAVILADCPTQMSYTSQFTPPVQVAVAAPVPTATPAAPVPFVAPPPAAPVAPPASVYYANCTEARAAGAAPILRGEPGYRPALDRDDDGVACE